MEIIESSAQPRAAPAEKSVRQTGKGECDTKFPFQESLSKPVPRCSDGQSEREKQPTSRSFGAHLAEMEVLTQNLVLNCQPAVEAIEKQSQGGNIDTEALVVEGERAEPKPANLTRVDPSTVLGEELTGENEESRPDNNPQLSSGPAAALEETKTLSEGNVQFRMASQNQESAGLVRETAEKEVKSVNRESIVMQAGPQQAAISPDLVGSSASIKPESHAISTEKVINQVVHLIKQQVKDGQKVLHIRMQPEDLGNVHVRLKAGKEGMQVIISADRSATGELLEANIRQLQERLSQAGIHLGEMSVGYFQRQMQEESGAWQQGKMPFPRVRTLKNPDGGLASKAWPSKTTISETALDFQA